MTDSSPAGIRMTEPDRIVEERSAAPLLEAEDLRVVFRVGSRGLPAVDGVDISVAPGETLGLVGESGSGKSTLARTLIRAYEPTSGRIIFDGQDITSASERELREVRRSMQIVFQDPYASLDARMSVRRIIAEPLVAHGYGSRREIRQRVDQLLEDVGLPPSSADRLPSQFSGGQRQRISIARALALDTRLLIADEPVSALDVSIQAQIVNLLREIQDTRGLAYLVIAHDLALVHELCDRVAVLYLGRIVEEGPTEQVVASPQHPYTAALLSATPVPDPQRARERIVLAGEPPSAMEPPSGCSFHPRCPIARPDCAEQTPPLVELSSGQRAACFYPGELEAAHGLTDLPRSPV